MLRLKGLGDIFNATSFGSVDEAISFCVANPTSPGCAGLPAQPASPTFQAQAQFIFDPKTNSSIPIGAATGINPNAPAGSQITVGGGTSPWYKTWWGMLGIGAVGFLAYKRFVAK